MNEEKRHRKMLRIGLLEFQLRRKLDRIRHGITILIAEEDRISDQLSEVRESLKTLQEQEEVA